MKKSLLVLALLFSLATFSQSPVDKSFPPEELFALGSYYYPEQWDSSQWERDLKKMSEMGIKFTHFAEFAWAMMEPEEGKYDFEWLDRAVSLAEKYGLKVIMCTPTPTPPAWLSKKYPDILIQRDNGVSIQHGRRPHASRSSNRYRRYVENIVSRLAMRYGNHPAVIGWQIDNEPGHYGVVDYSENAQAKFRIWLQKKYGTIDKLNDTWGASFWSETYQNFEQVRHPNQQEVPDKANPHAMLDLNRFMADELAGFVNMQADILRRHIHKDQWITTNLIPIFNPVDPVGLPPVWLLVRGDEAPRPGMPCLTLAVTALDGADEEGEVHAAVETGWPKKLPEGALTGARFALWVLRDLLDGGSQEC